MQGRNKNMGEIKIYTDGGSRSNPGPAAIAVMVLKNGKKIKEYKKFIGNATNNVAEYRAILKGLELAKNERVKVFSDSQLVVNQLIGNYKVKKNHLKKLFNKVKKKENKFEEVEYKHVKRENEIIKKVDKMVNQALNLAEAKGLK